MVKFSKIAPALLVAASAVGFPQCVQAQDNNDPGQQNRYFLLPFLLPRPAAVSPLAPPAAAPGATPGVTPGTPPGGPPTTPPGGPPTTPPVVPPAVLPPTTPPIPPTIGAPISVVLNGHNVCRPGAAPSHPNKPSSSKTPPSYNVPPSYDGKNGGGALCGVGEPNAIGSATILLARFPSAIQLCYALTVTGLDRPTASHIHLGRAGENGPSVVALTPPKNPKDGDPGASSGCVTISQTLAQAIHANPMAYYIDVETKAFPNGAIRGQL